MSAQQQCCETHSSHKVVKTHCQHEVDIHSSTVERNAPTHPSGYNGSQHGCGNLKAAGQEATFALQTCSARADSNQQPSQSQVYGSNDCRRETVMRRRASVTCCHTVRSAKHELPKGLGADEGQHAALSTIETADMKSDLGVRLVTHMPKLVKMSKFRIRNRQKAKNLAAAARAGGQLVRWRCRAKWPRCCFHVPGALEDVAEGGPESMGRCGSAQHMKQLVPKLTQAAELHRVQMVLGTQSAEGAV